MRKRNKKIIMLAVAALMAAGSALAAPPYTYSTVPGDPSGTRIYTLPNGLKVYLSVNKETPRIQTYIAVRTGSRNDPAETTGLAHYLEHLMFKGTKRFGTTDYSAEKPYLDDIERRYEHYRTLTDSAQRRQAYHEIDSVSELAARYNIPNEYDKLMSSIGAQGTNAYTSNDVTCYVEDIPSNEVDNWARVEADRFQNMVIRGFHTELEAVYEEYNIGLADDGRKSYDAINRLLYPTHPYGTQTTIGTQAHLKNPSITNIKNYFKRYYVPNNVAICMAGDLDPDKVIATIDRYFGSWTPSPALSRPEYAPMRPITAPVDTTVYGIESEYLMMGWRLPGASSPQCDTLSLISGLLYNGKAGLIDLDLNQDMKMQWAGCFVNDLNDYSTFMLEGSPNKGQSLEQVRSLLLAEIDKLKRGDFPDELIKSYISNMKLNYYKGLLSNSTRANAMVDAFINGKSWESVVHRIARLEGITKQQVMAFATRYLGNDYATVFKRQGEDTTLKKIDKPAITAIPANRDLSSPFLNEVKNAKVPDIEPQFVDYKRDVTDTKTSAGLPLVYKQNCQDGLFNLWFYYDFGTEDNKELSYAADYLDVIGTATKTAAQVKQAFYQLACNYSVSVSVDKAYISLSGLSENMPKALALLEDVLNHAKATPQSYASYVNAVEKNRDDNKKNQRANFSVLASYGVYGPYNANRNIFSVAHLRALDPQKLVDGLKTFDKMQHTVVYFGPMTVKELSSCLAKYHKTPKHLAPVPQGKPYTEQPNPATTEILVAPYEAKNIYMRMYHNTGRTFDLATAPVAAMFNKYFGGGMNTIVFQELRESRGLAYNAYAYYDFYPEVGHPMTYFTHIISQNDKMMDCIKVFNQILDTIPQSQSAFGIAKQSLTKSLQSKRVTRSSVLWNYIYQAKEHHLAQPLDKTVYEALPTLTLQDVVDFEQRNMAHKVYRYVILGDEKNIDMKALEKLGTVKRLTTEEIFNY
ncbi:MAG: insulinase family protein [Sodaliphilus pleomorphus]|uniref:M16 family metallopeptidase n=1 Tax=Sodaliphilus pleomorphus TaxID=2606626 RepID=UPI002A752DD9|nr:insulinase family protein [Sodaliphilus pleomorphus]MDY2833023.1 insulinase family protein [Sodaliphilus pleomorphus]